jgi:hypothetical protein
MPNNRTRHVSRTLGCLRDEGATVQRVEYWHPFAKRRIDLLGVADVLSLRSDPPSTTLVQVTDMAHRSAHLVKIDDEPRAKMWLKAGTCPECGHCLHRIELWSWRKLLRKRGGKAVRWTAKREEIR